MGPMLTRRRFFQALAASVFAAGVPLPIGLRRESMLFVIGCDLSAFKGDLTGVVQDGKSWATAYSTLSAALGRLEPGGNVFVRGTLSEEDVPFEGSSDPKNPTHLWGYNAKLESGKFTGFTSISNFEIG